ncbi:Ger(x)C family spore germination protein [Niallia sp. Krafla_26]|uniref:Ger(x)C family spore germination protein n=1 Tax=Niallia sp. Krafla_26 TaxID=3064703 RepID=UPI003D170F12
MKRNVQKILLSLFSLCLLTGCWSKRELNELAICVGLGIDKAEDGYHVTVQIVNPGELTGRNRSGRSEVITSRIKGETIFEALRKLSTVSPRKIYMSHLHQVVFGEELAREGINHALEFLARDHEVRPDFFIAIAKGTTAYNVLKVQSALENIPVNKMYNALDNSERSWSVTKTVKLDEVINSKISKGKQGVLTAIHLEGDPEQGSDFSVVQQSTPETYFHIGELGVLKGEKLIGWLTDDESKGFNYITNNVYNTLVTTPCQDGKISIETIRSETDIKSKMKKGKPHFDITLTTEGNIGEVLCDVDLQNPETIKKIEQRYEAEIKDKITKAIDRIKNDLHSDIFGLGEVLHISDPKAWHELESDWDEHLQDINVTVHVNAELRRLGNIINSYQNDHGGVE